MLSAPSIIFGLLFLFIIPLLVLLGLMRPALLTKIIKFRVFANRKQVVKEGIIALIVCLVLGVITAPTTFPTASIEPNSESTTSSYIKPQNSSTESANPASIAIDASSTQSISPDKTEAIVVKVIDGDTVDVSSNNKTERIRIIGINTPETVDPRKSVECFGEKASLKAKELLSGKTVWLEADLSQGERDKYNRLLRYVWINNATIDFGEAMISNGYAYEYTYNLPYKYQAEYKQAQLIAEQNKRGLWAEDACPTTVTPIPMANPTTTPVPSTSIPSSTTTSPCKYSCTSPDRDCSDFLTHTEAQTYFECCGFSVTNDPMKLDGVGVDDGIACESLP